jgi:hypothetical protein
MSEVEQQVEQTEENAVKPCIVTIFMSNIDMEMVQMQKKVVEKYNSIGVPHFHILTDAQPGETMDKVMEIVESNNFDAVMFLDVDAVPLHEKSIEYMFSKAYKGAVVGSAQRSNHIQNGQHVFAAPHNLTFTLETYKKIGKPSFNPNSRGDVSEEITFAAEENNVPVEILMPLQFDAPPIRMNWEPANSPPYWDLADGMPKYGIGTTFGLGEVGLFWHMYQSFYPGQKERFLNKCETLLQDA